MWLLVPTCLLVLFVSVWWRDRRALRCPVRPALMPRVDQPPATAGGRVPRGWRGRRRYVERGVEALSAYLREQHRAR
ncbi:hypothetical protein [Kineococcus sp. SYSU DK004]|uniref:hypothetical protein n=1 Tax=Kineococcus sp. SYSU DK004 TaxID=3383125 RepID=UPI003D7D731F